MEFLPELVRMFAMTSTQDDLFTFEVDGTIVKVPMAEYINILTFVKLKELEFKTPGWNWGLLEVPTNQFTSLIYPRDKLEDIYKLLLYYKDMRHDHETFLEFKRRFRELTDSSIQQRETRIHSIEEFHEFLSGNIPDDFDTFFVMLNDFYPNVSYDEFGEVITGVLYAGKDQNAIMKQEVQFLFDTYSPATPQDLFELIAIQDKEYLTLNNSVYDMLKTQFVYKYPRLVQKIESIDNASAFTDLFLLNYKRMLVEVIKMDNVITLFVNDTFQRYLLSNTFKEEFFDPVMELFQQYFFKAELSYQNFDQFLHITRDKMQQVTCGSENGLLVESTGKYETIDELDSHRVNIFNPVDEEYSLNDSWNVQISNTTNGIFVFDEASDSEYNHP